MIALFVLWLAFEIIKSKLDNKFKQNCYECKNYKLFDVASCGNGCRYKCTIKDRYDNHNMNDTCNFIKCKEFNNK